MTFSSPPPLPTPAGTTMQDFFGEGIFLVRGVETRGVLPCSYNTNSFYFYFEIGSHCVAEHFAKLLRLASNF